MAVAKQRVMPLHNERSSRCEHDHPVNATAVAKILEHQRGEHRLARAWRRCNGRHLRASYLAYDLLERAPLPRTAANACPSRPCLPRSGCIAGTKQRDSPRQARRHSHAPADAQHEKRPARSAPRIARRGRPRVGRAARAWPSPAEAAWLSRGAPDTSEPVDIHCHNPFAAFSLTAAMRFSP